jgi:GT2 family glycosyltransferase
LSAVGYSRWEGVWIISERLLLVCVVGWLYWTHHLLVLSQMKWHHGCQDNQGRRLGSTSEILHRRNRSENISMVTSNVINKLTASLMLLLALLLERVLIGVLRWVVMGLTITSSSLSISSEGSRGTSSKMTSKLA